jgi:formate dehydrogenase accessory protein FdhD
MRLRAGLRHREVGSRRVHRGPKPGDERGEILRFVEDVGRHNAVDAIAGWMWLEGIDGNDKIFYTTGRLTSEMVIKAAQMRIPVLVSRSGLTKMGHEVAKQVGITMIGRAVNRRYLLFTGAERLVRTASPPDAKAGAAARHG